MKEEKERIKMEEENGYGGSSGSTLETSKAERSVWLMKCPVAVAKSWQNHPPSQPLSKVVFSIDPLLPEDDPAHLQFTMEMSGTDSVNMAKAYSLNMFKDFVPMCIFSEASEGDKVAMEGKVEHKFDMKPRHENIDDYGKLCRERTKKSMIKNRQVQVIEDIRGVHMRPMPGMVGLVSSNFKDKKRTQPVKQTDTKRTRRDRGELEDIMFKLFERQPNWALKQLVQETDQPAQFLKEILNELCVYNKRGANQGTYELKPEYKKSVEDANADVQETMDHNEGRPTGYHWVELNGGWCDCRKFQVFHMPCSHVTMTCSYVRQDPSKHLFPIYKVINIFNVYNNSFFTGSEGGLLAYLLREHRLTQKI